MFCLFAYKDDGLSSVIMIVPPLTAIMKNQVSSVNYLHVVSVTRLAGNVLKAFHIHNSK